MRAGLLLLLLIDCGPGYDEAVDNTDTGIVAVDTVDQAEMAWVSLPDAMACGETTLGAITVRNAGTTTWTMSRGYKLGAVDDEDPFAATRVNMDAAAVVLPGEALRFAVELTAPAEPAVYATDWQMVREGMRWFGDVAAVEIEVSCP